MKNLLFIFFLLGCFNANLSAQCNTPQAPGTECASAPIYCEGIDGFCSSLSISTGSSGNFPGCNNEQLDNPHYLKFVAGSDFVELIITRSNCSGGIFGLTGIQAGLYTDCDSSDPLAIKCSSFSNVFSLTAVVTPGETYLLIIDGQYGSTCDYSIDVIDGSTVAPDVSNALIVVTGPEFVQLNGTYTFIADEVEGANYNWTIFGGELISGTGTNEVIAKVTDEDYFAACALIDNDCSDASIQSCKDYIVDPVSLNEIEVEICEGECYTFNGQNYCEEGTYDVNVNENGESVIYRIFVSIVPTTITTVNQTACFGECVNYNGIDYCETGQYSVILSSSIGCDSLINLSVVILSENGPSLQASNSGELDCINTSATLFASSSVSGSNFAWSGPGITEDNVNDPSPEVSVPGIYTVIATSPQGCTSTATTEVFGTSGDPIVTISGNVPLNCNNDLTTLTAESSNTIATYQWTGPNGFTYDGPTITTGVIGDYEVTVTTPNGCTGSKSIIVFANNAQLIVDAGPNRHIQCEFFIELEAEGAEGDNVDYQWTTWNGNIVNGANTLTPLISKAGFYTLTATRPADGCSGSATIRVYDKLAVIENNALEISCAVPTLQIDATESYSGDNATIQWTTSNGNIVSGANTLTPTIDAAGTYRLVVAQPICSSIATITVTDDLEVPSISLSASAPVSICYQPVTLTADVSPADAALSWSKNGVVLGNETTLTVNDGGTYTLEAVGSNACTGTQTITIGAEQDPADVYISGDLTLDCALNGFGMLNATVTGSSSSYLFEWFAVDGGEIVSNNNVSTVNINGGGSYCVSVTGSNCNITYCIEVIELSSIALEPTITNASCPTANDGGVELEVIGGEAPYAYEWNTGATSASLTEVIPGLYSVTLTDDNGCKAFRSFIVESDGTVNIAASAGDNQFYDCSTGSLSLNGESSVFPEGSIFQWTTADGTIDSGANTLTPVVSGPGTYTLTIDNGQGCSSMDEVLVIEYQANAGTDRSISCEQPTTQLNALENITGATLQWSTEDGNIVEGEDSATPIVDAAGTYQLEVTLQSGCIYTDEAVVTANINEPELSVANAEVALTDCTNPVTISASTSTPGTSLSWIGPSGTADDASFTVYDAGTYTVTATAPNGCTSTETVLVIDESDAPDISAPQIQYINCYNGDPLILSVYIDGGFGNYDVIWDTEDGNIVSGVGITIQVDAAGTYVVTAVDDASGCDASFSIIVEERDAEVEVSSTLASCGINDGSATVNTNFIHEPVFLWNTGATTASITGLTPGSYSVTVSSMASTSCSVVKTVEVMQETACDVLISGFILEGDHCTSAANPVEGVLVSIEPEGLETNTDIDGYYEFLVPAGTYTITPVIESPFVLECPSNTIEVEAVPGTLESANNNFYTKALSGFDLYLAAVSGSATAGSNQNYQMNYCNGWITTIFGTVVFTHDPLLEFDPVAAGADAYDPTTHTARFNFTNLGFFGCQYKSFSLYVPENVPDGTVLTTTVTILPIQGDQSPNNNTVTWTKTVSNGGGSFTDPNVPGNAASSSAFANNESITILDQYPNPFRAETTIEFNLQDAKEVELQVFDAAGRMVKSYTGYENGWNKQVINGDELSGFGVYLYRIVGPDMVVSGRMVRK